MASARTDAGSGGWTDFAGLYYRSARRAVSRYGFRPVRAFRALDDRPIFVVGSPRSGTSFTAAAIGSVAGFADLGELRPLKRAIPDLANRPANEAAARIRSIMALSQRFGQVAGMRPIEQTPESTFLIPAIRRAYPEAAFVHLVRDGRDVAASLIELGWLRSAEVHRRDEVGHWLGDHRRFWLEPERASDFSAASEATRAAWVWRRYESVARKHLADAAGRTLEVRYERLVRHPDWVADELAVFLHADNQLAAFHDAFAPTVSSASGRWCRDLDQAQLADVEAEAGGLLRELNYT